LGLSFAIYIGQSLILAMYYINTSSSKITAVWSCHNK